MSDQAINIASEQLSTLINQNATDGWELMQLGGKNIEVAPGCLASLLGAKASYVRYDQLIFRKPV